MRSQIGSAARTTLIAVVGIITFLVVAFMLLPKGFSGDISIIGQGSNVVVLAHNKDSVKSLNLMEYMNQVRGDYSDRVEFRVADMNTPQGRTFLDKQKTGLGVLLMFGPDGTRRRIASDINDQTALRAAIDATFQ
jgi:hypothetical protein